MKTQTSRTTLGIISGLVLSDIDADTVSNNDRRHALSYMKSAVLRNTALQPLSVCCTVTRAYLVQAQNGK